MTNKPNTTTTTAAAPLFLTPAELRVRWKCSAMYLVRMRAENRLPISKFGKRAVRIAMADVLRIEAESAV